MALDPNPQGRKRGRPANASKQAPSASQDRPDEYEADVEEAARPKQRGRPKKKAQEDAPGEEVAQAEKPKKKRGRPSPEDRNAEKSTENAPQPKRKRGRPSLERNQDAQEADPETVEEAVQPKRKRARPSLEKNQDEEPKQETEDAGKQKRKKKSKETQIEEPEEQPEEQPQPRKKGRKAAQQPEPEAEQAPAPRKRQRHEIKESGPEPVSEQEAQPRRSPRNSLRDLGEDANNKGSKAERSKKKKDRVSQENAEDEQLEDAPKKRGRPKGGRPSAETADEPQEEPQETNKKKRRGKEKDDAPSDSDESLASPPKPYIHIASFKRTIRSSKVAADWTGLSGASLPTTKSILKLAQQPILQRMAPTNNRRTHASAALHLVYRRMERKLARGLPFPPGNPSSKTTKRRLDADGGRALELDFEAVLDGKAALERQLVPGMHAVELLKAEKERMERELERDYEKLRNLEANARAQTRERKDLFRKAHVLAPTSRPASKDQDTTFVTDTKDQESLKDIVNTPLEPIALQLADHVESIRGNLQQADGLTPQLSRTKAALQDVLQRYLDEVTYEQVVLG
ncbi:related to cylicin II [Fusarium fujikuroi]|uniref:Related to cylicin II n=1 Tax=Gibberella fujikuroi (strain CBS 195.34 / IMI 58289 / NRRL A-6831) TaxID=1279085 RepID=S0EAJ3_GIBF5|nr:related to cylicin II [Fusarium fujikuroi IMI 58289]KLO82115.1 cylicin II [Fusarium fujikuroi]KLP21245.1 cylicin II [Fusarium fujikuroi]CCT71899.1 related to cylicin II [Fusarium fujikuroi IMI 58289]SCO11260.1 related to cylicin II [Fusarium fujikuroi]SCO19494.1 related to cylicin II [Fusarium fujikuroi]